MLKTLAIVLMVVDHAGLYLFSNLEIMRWIGRFAAPIFLFMVGYSLRYSIKKDIIFHAVILSVLSIYLCNYVFPINILFTIIFARLVLVWLEKKKLLGSQLPIVWFTLALWGLVTFFFFEYGAVGILYSICGYLVAKNRTGIIVFLFLYATVGMHVLVQKFLFDFDEAELAVLFLGLCLMTWWLSNYKFHTYKASGAWTMPIKFISRYSLELYTFHLIFLRALDSLFFSPEKYATFSWF